MGIHQSGQQRGVAEIDNVGVRGRLGSGQVDVGDAGTLEQDGGGAPAQHVPVEEPLSSYREHDAPLPYVAMQ